LSFRSVQVDMQTPEPIAPARQLRAFDVDARRIGTGGRRQASQSGKLTFRDRNESANQHSSRMNIFLSHDTIAVQTQFDRSGRPNGGRPTSKHLELLALV
jgi:hypothetical protein